MVVMSSMCTCKKQTVSCCPRHRPPTTGARKGRKKLDGKSNHSTSSTAAETETSSRNREVKIRLSMAEEEVISPSPTEKRHARFQRPSLEQRQKLLAIAHDITNVLDTYSKEYSDSEKVRSNGVPSGWELATVKFALPLVYPIYFC